MAQQAIKTAEGGVAVVVENGPTPELRDDHILAETRAVGLNPTDWKHMTRLAEAGATLGCDWSGVVVKVGKSVTKFKPGDEVMGVVHGGNTLNPEGGSFARFVTCADMATYHKPSSMSFEEAAALGVGLITVGQTMYYMAKLPLPSADNLKKEPTRDILVYGGSSATGTIAIQMARLSGCRVIATSSPSNFDLVKSRGASHVFSSYSPDTTIPEIQSLIKPKDGLTYVYDCIGNESSATFCAPLLSHKEAAHYHSVQYPLVPRLKELRPEESVCGTSALAYTVLAEPFVIKGIDREFSGDEQEKQWAADVWGPAVESLLTQGLITPHPVHVRKAGLKGVIAGMEEMERGEAPSGKKLVYALEW